MGIHLPEIGRSAMSRHTEKRHMIVEWLSIFHYSTPQVLLAMLGVKNKQIFSTLKKSGFLRVVKTDMVAGDLLMLERQGFDYAKVNFESSIKYSGNPRSINHSLVKHELSLQLYAIRNRDELQDIQPARLLDYTARAKLPDCIATFSGHKLAIEIERFHKSKSRIYQAFYNHALAIGKMRYYDTVVYVFPTQNLCNLYSSLFAEEEWPVYQYSQKSRRYILTEETYSASDKMRLRFRFEIMDMF